MNILIIGGGGREHAFAWKIKQSDKCEKLFIAPGNAGTATCGENVAISVDDFDRLGQLCLDQQIDLVVVGPEAPLVKGIRDHFQADEQLKHILMVGPGKLGAQLEGSKDFSKKFMLRHQIPTAKAMTFTEENLEDGLDYIATCNTPVVLKADGLAAGKGVIIAHTYEEAYHSFRDMLVNKKFGEASASVLVEEFLEGIELSVFVLTDGNGYVILPEAKDYKRIGDGDTGLNTGGMGAVSPVLFADQEFMNRVEKEVVIPTIEGLAKDNIPFKGFLFIGLMNTGGQPNVIEYNVRMGDPETQVVLPRLKSDLLELFEATAKGTLENGSLEAIQECAVTVVKVSGGYPEGYKKGHPIMGLEDASEALVFHAGTKVQNDQVVTDGGRVLAITGIGVNLKEARDRAYAGNARISWEQEFFRKDIGLDLIQRGQH